MLARVKDFFNTWLLLELGRGLAAHRPVPVRAQGDRPVPGGEDAAEPALPRPARAAPLSERRGALHRLQAVRGGLPGARDHHRIRAARRRHAPHDALRHRPRPSASSAASARRAARSTRSSRRASSSTTARSAATCYYTKEMLLAVGDRYEAQIAADRTEDASYR